MEIEVRLEINILTFSVDDVTPNNVQRIEEKIKLFFFYH